MLFGMTGTPVGIYIKFACRILITILSKENDAKIVIPDDSKIREYQDVIGKKYPSLKGSWYVMDGVKLTIQQP